MLFSFQIFFSQKIFSENYFSKIILEKNNFISEKKTRENIFFKTNLRNDFRFTSSINPKSKTQNPKPIDSLPQQINLMEIEIKSIRIVNGTGHLNDVAGEIIYAGKKNEVIVIDSLDANKAINNTRQILGRVPGLNISETESGGFTANGVGFRGLNPSQSIETNTRQNGYNVSADIYGYNEAYYLPPMEAVERIEVVRGASSLQFGAQFGGVINYIVKQAPTDKTLSISTSQTGGSFGLFNSFTSVSGTLGKFSYMAFVQYRNLQGWRPNSEQTQLSGFGRIAYKLSDNFSISLEYSLLRNRIRMPGGLNDSMFEANPKSSFRARNWLESPWNVVNLTTQYKFSPHTSISLQTSVLTGARNLVWRNEDGGPGALDTIDADTHQYSNREVQREKMQSITNELRFKTDYTIGKQIQTLATGVRVSYAKFKRQGGGVGTTGSDFDLTLLEPEYAYDLDFTTTNIAPFAENIFRLSNKFSVTPGLRFEYLNSTAKGYITDGVTEQNVYTDLSQSRTFALFGLGTQYALSRFTNVYANFSQAYRPIDYNQLTPFGSTSKIDKNLKDATGFNADFGYRGTLKNYLNFDVGLFLLQYNNRIGIVEETGAQGNTYTIRKNIANSVHKGLETYVEFNLSKYLNPTFLKGGLSIFNALSLIDARYTSGEYENKHVEYAPSVIERIGITYAHPVGFSITAQWSHQSESFGDASNTVRSDDPVVGIIPAYSTGDISFSYKFSKIILKGGINNVTDEKYFTRRTDEYPGPGIIPAVGRSMYLGITLGF